MHFTTYIAALAVITGTQAAPTFGKHWNHNSTDVSDHPSYGGRFNLTQVLEEHDVNLSDFKNLNVTELLGKFGVTVPANFDFESAIDEWKNKHNITSGNDRFNGGNFFNHNHTKPSFTRSSYAERPSHTGGFLGGWFGHGHHHDHDHGSSAVSSAVSTATASSSEVEPSATSSISSDIPTSIDGEFSILPISTPSASASFGDFIDTGSEVIPSATTSFSEPSSTASDIDDSTSFISTVTQEDAGLPGPTLGVTPDDEEIYPSGDGGNLLDLDATVSVDIAGAEVTADVNLDI